MTNLLKEYIKETKESGRKKSLKPYAFTAFDKYLNETMINFKRLKAKEAQEFQSWLLTCHDEENKIHYTTATVAAMITDLKYFYSWLKKKKKVPYNPFLQIKRVFKKKKLPEIPDEEKIFILLNHLKNFHNQDELLKRKQLYKAHVVCELIYSTGLYINEIMSLKTKNVDLEKGLVYYKGKKYLLNDFTKSILKVYLEEMREILLSGANHQKQGDLSLLFGSKNNLRKWLNPILQRETKGVFTSKVFRHALILHLLKNKADVRFIQEILGFKNLHSIQMYIRMDKENLRTMIDEHHPRSLRKEL